jgi:hypothetical protein
MPGDAIESEGFTIVVGVLTPHIGVVVEIYQ